MWDATGVSSRTARIPSSVIENCWLLVIRDLLCSFCVIRALIIMEYYFIACLVTSSKNSAVQSVSAMPMFTAKNLFFGGDSAGAISGKLSRRRHTFSHAVRGSGPIGLLETGMGGERGSSLCQSSGIELYPITILLCMNMSHRLPFVYPLRHFSGVSVWLSRT